MLKDTEEKIIIDIVKKNIDIIKNRLHCNKEKIVNNFLSYIISIIRVQTAKFHHLRICKTNFRIIIYK